MNIRIYYSTLKHPIGLQTYIAIWFVPYFKKNTKKEKKTLGSLIALISLFSIYKDNEETEKLSQFPSPATF